MFSLDCFLDIGIVFSLLIRPTHCYNNIEAIHKNWLFVTLWDTNTPVNNRYTNTVCISTFLYPWLFLLLVIPGLILDQGVINRNQWTELTWTNINKDILWKYIGVASWKEPSVGCHKNCYKYSSIGKPWTASCYRSWNTSCFARYIQSLSLIPLV